MALTDFYAPKIRAAMSQLVTDEQIRSALHASGGDPAALKTAISALTPDTTALSAVLADLAADGFVSGLLFSYLQLMAIVATGKIAKGTLTKADAPVPNWDNWSPGDVTAANVTVKGGLADLLSAQQVSIQYMSSSALGQLGDVLSVSLASGEPVDELADNLDKYAYVLPGRGDIIAHTETSRAVHAATFEAYDANGVEQWNIVLSDGACQDCQDVYDNGPYPAADQGDAPPVHPYCRCTTAPAIDPSKLKAAAEDLAIGGGALALAEHEGEDEAAEGEDGLLRALADRLDGYLNGQVLGDYTTDIQGRRLALAVGREAIGNPDAANLEAATDEELAAAVAAAPSTTEVGEDASETLLEELDSRDEDDVTAAAEQAALAWDGTGTPPANPYAGTDLADVWQSAFDDARRDPKAAQADLADYNANQLEG